MARRDSLRATVLLAVGANVLVITLPLLVSRDVYSYIAYGNIAGLHHANPYVQTRSTSRATPSSMLGRAEVALDPGRLRAVVHGVRVGRRQAGPLDPAQVEVFRWTALCASLGTIALIVATVRRVWPSRAAFAVAAFGMNPVVLFQSVASGHNDLLVALAVAGAFALVLAGHRLLAVTALTLGTLVKVVAGLPLLLLVVWCVARAPAGRRVRTLVTHAGLAAAIGRCSPRRSSTCTIRRSACSSSPVTRVGWRRRASSAGCSMRSRATRSASSRGSRSPRCSWRSW